MLACPAAGLAYENPIDPGPALRHGFENVEATTIGDAPFIAFENRRFRHTAYAVGLLHAEYGGHTTVLERRLGLDVAAIRANPRAAGFLARLVGQRDSVRFEVHYPSDGGFAAPVPGTPQAPTPRTVDFTIGPLLAYEFSRILDPLLVRLELEASMRYNPWPGAQATAAVIVPVYNDFERTDLAPDIGRVRPGPLKLDQFAWIPGVALSSISTGYFAQNRYGISFGLARPLAGGEWLLDAQADATGFMSFTEGGTRYSTVSVWTGFAGVTWNAPVYDLSVRARGMWYLYQDRGIEIEVKRRLGDLSLAVYTQRIEGEGFNGVRLELPIPPMVRNRPDPVRLQPVERFPLSYRDQAIVFGTELVGAASRSRYLEQTTTTALQANLARYGHGLTGEAPEASSLERPRVNLHGMTGFVNTPWAGTMADRRIALSYSHTPARWAYDNRGDHANDVYAGTVGFLPGLELSLRWTHIVGLRDFEAIIPDSELPDLDRTASVRLSLIKPEEGRPGLALGVDDVLGTRRFHSTYAVAGLPTRIFGMHTRLGIGYASKVFTASRYILDGAFGALEVSPWRTVALEIEYDSEKWNVGLDLAPGWGLGVKVAALDFDTASVSAGWSWPL